MSGLTDSSGASLASALLRLLAGNGKPSLGALLAQFRHSKDRNAFLSALCADKSSLDLVFRRTAEDTLNGLDILIEMRGAAIELASVKGAPSPNVKAFAESLRAAILPLVVKLDLTLLSWDSPASLLERVIQNEGVHSFPTFTSIKQRLGASLPSPLLPPARHIFALVHPTAMRNDPLSFVQIALVSGVASRVQRILTDPDPALSPTADTAIFYSITSPHAGMTGIDMGKRLLYEVVPYLQRTYPNVRTYCTLSPVPGFRKWVEAEQRKSGQGVVVGVATAQLAGYKPVPMDSPVTTDEISRDLVRLACAYLLGGRRGVSVLDPVGNFHIRNGALVHRINICGNDTPRSIAESYGVMVNYAYVPERIERNARDYGKGLVPVTREFVEQMKEVGVDVAGSYSGKVVVAAEGQSKL